MRQKKFKKKNYHRRKRKSDKQPQLYYIFSHKDFKKYFKWLTKQNFVKITNKGDGITNIVGSKNIKGNQFSNIDYQKLSSELENILKQIETSSANDRDKEFLQEAYKSSQAHDKKKTVINLNAVGSWLLNFATTVGADYVVSLLSNIH